MSVLKEMVEILSGKQLLTRKCLARRYGVDIDTIDRWKARGTLPRPKYLPGCRLPFWSPAIILANERHSKKLTKRLARVAQA
jgi:hypothetical protein